MTRAARVRTTVLAALVTLLAAVGLVVVAPSARAAIYSYDCVPQPSARTHVLPDPSVAVEASRPRPSATFADGPTPAAASGFAANSEAGGAALDEAFHYTSREAAESIASTGLRKGGYATPAGDLSPLQAQLELALNPTRALPTSVLRIDVAGLREAGFDIPEVTRVSNVVKDWGTGRVYTMPGGGWEMQFPDWIPPEFLKVVR